MNATKTEIHKVRINSREEIQTTCSQNPMLKTHAVDTANNYESEGWTNRKSYKNAVHSAHHTLGNFPAALFTYLLTYLLTP
jgi:hypothetical protein